MSEWISLLLFREAIELAGVGIVIGCGLAAIASALSAFVAFGLRILHKTT